MFCIGVVTLFSVRIIERYEKKDFKAWFKKQSKYVSNHFVSGSTIWKGGSTMGVQSQSRVLSNSWWDGGCLKGALGAMRSQRATSLITPNFSAHTIEFPSNLLLVMLRNIKTKGWILYLPPWIVLFRKHIMLPLRILLIKQILISRSVCSMEWATALSKSVPMGTSVNCFYSSHNLYSILYSRTG